METEYEVKSKEAKPKVGRKPLPVGSKRRMYSARLHPDIIAGLNRLKTLEGRPVSRIIESLISREIKRLGL
jgi:hypothetical protein